MSRGRSLIALTVIFAGLVGYWYFVDRNKPVTPEGTEVRDKVFGIESDKIESLRIKSSAGETSSLVKDKDVWQLKEPVAVRADESEVSGITSNLSSLEIQRVVDENPKDVGQYGLSQPRVEIAFKTGGKERRLAIGEKTATGGDLYARRDNEPRVFLIPAYLDTTFDRKPFDLRDKSILKFDRDKVDRLELARDGQRVEAVKGGLDWLLTVPVKTRADYSAVEGLVTRLQSAQMKAVVAENPSSADLEKWGLAKPGVTATVGAGSSRASLAFGKATPESENDVYARDLSQPMVVTVAKDLLDEVKKDVSELRRKDIFEFRSFNVSRLEITRGSDTYVFEKVKGSDNVEKWRRTSPKAGDVDTAKMETALTKLTAMRAQSFVQTPSGAVPALTVAARFDEGKKNERVRIDRKGDEVLAVRGDEPDAARVNASELDEALTALDALK
jgi:hypothetical protein